VLARPGISRTHDEPATSARRSGSGGITPSGNVTFQSVTFDTGTIAADSIRRVPRARRDLEAVPDDRREHALTIEQLAVESGLSVRNIRSHQARGLLPPPEVRRRVGYYGPEHIERLRVIGELQAQGLHLKAVKQLLDDTQGTVERLLSLRRTIAEPVALERSETVTEAELDELLAQAGAETPKLLGKLTDLGGTTKRLSERKH